MPQDLANLLSLTMAVCAAILAQMAVDVSGEPKNARTCARLSGLCLGIGACFYMAARF